MNSETKEDKPVTHAVFSQGMKSLNEKIDVSVKRLDEKINKVAVGLVKVEGRLERVENTMATKTDLQDLSSKVDSLIGMWKEQYQKGFFNQNRLNELDDQVANHEKRLVVLEGAGSRRV